MDFEFETTRTGLANAFADAGAELLNYMGVGAALAAIPDTEPQQYAVAGTLQMIGKMLPAPDAVSQPTGDLTDEQIIKMHDAVFGWLDDGYKFVLKFARDIERAAIAAHLARQPKAEQPVTAVPPADVIAAAETRSFWVLEKFTDGRSAGYWDGGHSQSFTDDINKACQFCRKEDVFWATRGWRGSGTQLTEHVMLGAAPTAAQAAGSSVTDLPAIKTWQERAVELGEKALDPKTAYGLLQAEIDELRAHLARQAQAEPAGFISICEDEIALSLTSMQREILLAKSDAPIYLVAPVAPAGAQNEEILALHRQLAAEKMRADQGWERAEAKSKECIELRERMAGAQNAEAIRNQAEPEPEQIECWSRDQEDFNARSLCELLDSHDDLKPGDTVWVGEAVHPKPERLVNEDGIIENIGEAAYDIGGEYAEDYPDVTPEQAKELESLVADWIKRTCPPTFYTVENIKPYVLTHEDFSGDLQTGSANTQEGGA